jgi:hypothetical protein
LCLPGIGLSIFGSVLQEIFYFKPQVIYVSIVFLTVLAYIFGEAMAYAIPRVGKIGRFLNPGPFNGKEHAAIALMASASSQSALATQALAAQQLFYGGYPSHAAGIFITISSQLLGFGIAGLLREILVHPTKMLWPMNLPITTLLESLHRDKKETKHKLKIFYVVFFVIFVWEVIPEVRETPFRWIKTFELMIKTSIFLLYWKEFQYSVLPIKTVWFLPIFLEDLQVMKDLGFVSFSPRFFFLNSIYVLTCN